MAEPIDIFSTRCDECGRGVGNYSCGHAHDAAAFHLGCCPERSEWAQRAESNMRSD